MQGFLLSQGENVPLKIEHLTPSSVDSTRLSHMSVWLGHHTSGFTLPDNKQEKKNDCWACLLSLHIKLCTSRIFIFIPSAVNFGLKLYYKLLIPRERGFFWGGGFYNPPEMALLGYDVIQAT